MKRRIQLIRLRELDGTLEKLRNNGFVYRIIEDNRIKYYLSEKGKAALEETASFYSLKEA